MSIRVALQHHTQYDYDQPVWLSPQRIRLKPAAHSQARLESYCLTVQPVEHSLHWQQDPFGNFIARADFMDALQTLVIVVEMEVLLQAVNPFDFLVESQAQTFPFYYDPQLEKDLQPYRETTPPGPALTQWLRNRDVTPGETVEFLQRLNQQVYQSIGYRVRLEAGVQTAEETLRHATGSCRDSAWLLVAILRHLGLAARFVSGYLVQLASADESLDQRTAPGADTLDLHAWAEVYLPGAGWIGLDPTSGLLTTEVYLPLACTPEPSNAAPVTGTSGTSAATLSFFSSVTRL